MKLVALSMVKNEEYWIWYSLTSAYPWVDELLVLDNFSDDRTVEIVRNMPHIADKLTLIEQFGTQSEHENREAMLEIARGRGATHILYLDGDEVHSDENLKFARSLLEMHEHVPQLNDPPQNHGRPGDSTPTDGIRIKHLGFRPLHPSFEGPATCSLIDFREMETNHGCYNYSIRLSELQGLRGNGKEWGQHGFLGHDGVYMQSSPHTLWMPKLFYYHFSWHPRSSVRDAQTHYGHAPMDLGCKRLPPHVTPPAVLFREDGPSNPTLNTWRQERVLVRRSPVTLPATPPPPQASPSAPAIAPAVAPATAPAPQTNQ